jgi:hypothetical protein
LVADVVPPEFDRFLRAQERAGRSPRAAAPLAAGDVAQSVFLRPEQAGELMSAAARLAVGLFRPTRRAEAVWVRGESQLAVGLTGIRVTTAEGLVGVVLPVRCDQTGRADVTVTFAVGSDAQPAGLFAAAHRRPAGPEVVVAAWGENLVAFAWQCLLGLVSGISGAVGKDGRGNLLVPAEVVANADGLRIVPMARHRFAGSTGLATRRADR